MKNLPDAIGTPKRKSGGQPGNQNARKYGLYSKHLPSKQPRQSGDAPLIGDLAPEIAAARVRLNALLNDPEVSTDHILKAVNILTKLIAIQHRCVQRGNSIRFHHRK